MGEGGARAYLLASEKLQRALGWGVLADTAQVEGEGKNGTAPLSWRES